MKRTVAVFPLLLTACSAAHISTYQPKRRTYEPIVAQEPGDSEQTDGSIWSTGADGNSLVTDVRAFRSNDLVTVYVEELASAKRSADTQVDRDGSFNFGGDVAGMIKNSGTIDPNELMTARSGSSHDASGRTSRREDVKFKVAATVTQVLPNGNLFLEGHRVVLVNDEEHHFYISGVARPADIRNDNSISSIQLADAEIEFVGDGVISEGQRPGWLTRVMNYINPL